MISRMTYLKTLLKNTRKLSSSVIVNSKQQHFTLFDDGANSFRHSLFRAPLQRSAPPKQERGVSNSAKLTTMMWRYFLKGGARHTTSLTSFCQLLSISYFHYLSSIFSRIYRNRTYFVLQITV